MQLLYLRDWVDISSEVLRFLTYTFLIVLIIIALILISKEKMQLEHKFGYFSIGYVFFGIQFFHTVVSLIFFAFILLLYVPHLIQNEKGINFIKQNSIVLIGLFSIIGISFISHEFIIYELIPVPKDDDYPLIIFDNLRWIFLLSIMLISLMERLF